MIGLSAVFLVVVPLFAATLAAQDTGPDPSAVPATVPPVSPQANPGTQVAEAEQGKNVPPTLTAEGVYDKSFKALFILFILAVVLESGLAVLFNWRPFIATFDSRGVKTLIAFAISVVFVRTFELDITTSLINIYRDPATPFESSFLGEVITALVVAGGSSGVNNLMTGLGFRSIRTAATVEPKPKPTEAWISVRLVHTDDVLPVNVVITDQAGTATVAGVIHRQSKGNSFLRHFIRDPGRFPTAGGYSLLPNVDYSIHLEGVDSTGTVTKTPTWGPHQLAPGAIIDIELGF